MATRSVAVQATSQQEMENMISGYIAQGFNVANRTATSVTLVKRKEFSVLWAVIGFIVCVLPLLIYLIVYALESDQMVVINLVQPGAYAQPQAAISPPANVSGNMAGTLSPDGRYYWDGTAWQPVEQQPPTDTGNMTLTSYNPSAPRSPDGRYWWDGRAWQPIPRTPGQDASPYSV